MSNVCQSFAWAGDCDSFMALKCDNLVIAFDRGKWLVTRFKPQPNSQATSIKF